VQKVLKAIERIVRPEARASGATKEPTVEYMESSPVVTNDATASERTRDALTSIVGKGLVIDPGLVTGSEDVGVLATAAKAPLVYWLLGGADPGAFAAAKEPKERARIARAQPPNHSPRYAPVKDPTIRIGVDALAAAAREWLDGASEPSS